jgi:hypothetical protein
MCLRISLVRYLIQVIFIRGFVLNQMIKELGSWTVHTGGKYWLSGAAPHPSGK